MLKPAPQPRPLLAQAWPPPCASRNIPRRCRSHQAAAHGGEVPRRWVSRTGALRAGAQRMSHSRTTQSKRPCASCSAGSCGGRWPGRRATDPRSGFNDLGSAVTYKVKVRQTNGRIWSTRYSAGKGAAYRSANQCARRAVCASTSMPPGSPNARRRQISAASNGASGGTSERAYALSRLSANTRRAASGASGVRTLGPPHWAARHQARTQTWCQEARAG